jgi:hypothetical protein
MGTLVELSLKWRIPSDGSQRVLAPPVEGSWPAARVGSSLVEVAGKLYLWGGRGGKDMGVFGADEDLWTFDVQKESWESLNTTGEKPEQRSFHVMAAVAVRSSSSLSGWTLLMIVLAEYALPTRWLPSQGTTCDSAFPRPRYSCMDLAPYRSGTRKGRNEPLSPPLFSRPLRWFRRLRARRTRQLRYQAQGMEDRGDGGRGTGEEECECTGEVGRRVGSAG